MHHYWVSTVGRGDRTNCGLPDTEGLEDTRDAIERILDEYFACYGVLFNVAVFPCKTEKELSRTNIDFSRIDNTQPGSVLPNPFESDGVTFEASDQPNSRIVDIFPVGGDGAGELDLHRKMLVTLPADIQVEKVEAKVVHFNPDGVTMEAFNDNGSIELQIAGPEQNEEHDLVIEGEGITHVIFTAPENEAVLLKFAYSVAEEVKVDPSEIDLEDYPHIIDFEPKTRDLYQAASETGEILTGSKSGVKTDKSFTHTESTEDKFSVGVVIPGESGESIAGKAGFSRTNTDIDQEQWAVQTDASRERRENQSTTTQLSQMYNLLTSYHIGTNRASRIFDACSSPCSTANRFSNIRTGASRH